VTGAAATLQCVEAGVPDGSWEYTVTPVLGGFTGAASARRAVTVDTTPPPAPSAVSVTAGGPVQASATCGVAAGTRFVNRAGRAAVGVSVTIAAPEAGERVVLSATTPGSTPVTANVAAASTTVTATLDLTSLLDGAVTLTARTQDATGNASAAASPANAIVKDTVAAALGGLSYTNVVLLADSMGGTSECGATIVATETVGPNVGRVFPTSGTFVVGAAGTFSGFTLDAVSLGAYSYTVVATDLAGNASAGTVLSGSDLL
jgi:hypothetical protein